RGAMEQAEEYLCSNCPANSYGLLDHAADKERSAALVLVRAALATPSPAATALLEDKRRLDWLEEQKDFECSYYLHKEYWVITTVQMDMEQASPTGKT